MRATGEVRRIDDLGRIVIPKNVRKTLELREGDPMEIFYEDDKTVILKPYIPPKQKSTMDKNYVKFIIAYDYEGVFSDMKLTCDEAFELAGVLYSMWVEQIESEDEDCYEGLIAFLERTSFNDTWDEYRERMK